jgi:hypothetical protein
VLVIAIVWYSYMYWVDEARPGDITRPGPDHGMGWLGWADQGELTRIAKILASHNLPIGGATYPLGYPLLGAIFFWAYPHHFFIPNLILFSVPVVLYYLIAKKFLPANLAFLSIILLIGGTWYTRLMLIPWSPWVAVFSFGFLAYFALIKEKLTFFELGIAGFLWGFTFTARTIELFVLFPTAAFLLSRNVLLENETRKKLYSILSFLIPFFIISGLVLYSNFLLFGGIFNTGYDILIPGTIYKLTDVSKMIFPDKLPVTLYSLIVNPRLVFNLGIPRWDVNEPLLWHSFFFIFAPIGALLLFKGKNKWPMGVIFTSFFLSVFIYTANGFVTADSLKYLVFKEFVMWFPLITILSVYGLNKLSEFKNNTREDNTKIIGCIVVIILAVLFVPISQLLFGSFSVPKEFLISTSKTNYSVGETVDVYAQILDINGKPVIGQKILGRYELENKIIGGLEFVSSSDGRYYSAFSADKAGKYKITLFSPTFGGTTPETPIPTTVINVE